MEFHASLPPLAAHKLLIVRNVIFTMYIKHCYLLFRITEGVRCVGWTCDDVGCLRQYLTPDSAARVQCQQYGMYVIR